MATKANHHFVPQYYLRGFAEGVGRQAKVYVFDSKSNKAFTTLVRNVGSRRHFNRVEIDGVDPNAVEDGIAEAEAEFANHLRDVIEAKTFPSPQHFNSMMNIIANISVRNPRLRANLVDSHKQILENVMEVALLNKDRWGGLLRRMKEDGFPVNENLTFEDVKNFHEKGEYDILIDQTYLIKLELKALDPALNCLARRNWSFVTAAEATQFICSDDPVALCWADESEASRIYSPGHGLKSTRLFFPVCSNLLLIGVFEGISSSQDFSASQVAAANTTIAMHSTNQIYARNDLFSLMLASGEIVSGHDLSSKNRR